MGEGPRTRQQTRTSTVGGVFFMGWGRGYVRVGGGGVGVCYPGGSLGRSCGFLRGCGGPGPDRGNSSGISAGASGNRPVF